MDSALSGLYPGMLSAGRLRGPGGPGALYFCGRAAPARGAHPDRGPPPAKTSNCRAGLPAWCLSPRGSRCSCSDRPLSRLGDWDTDSDLPRGPLAADQAAARGRRHTPAPNMYTPQA